MSNAGIAHAKTLLGGVSSFVSSKVLANNITNQSLSSLLDESITRIEGPTIPPIPGVGPTLSGVGRPPRFTEIDKVSKIQQDITQLTDSIQRDPTFMIPDDELRSHVAKVPVRGLGA
jgi:hypothetical protein